MNPRLNKTQMNKRLRTLLKLTFSLSIVLLPLSFVPKTQTSNGASSSLATPPSWLVEGSSSKRFSPQQDRLSSPNLLAGSSLAFIFPIIFLISCIFLISFFTDRELLLRQGRLQLEGG